MYNDKKANFRKKPKSEPKLLKKKKALNRPVSPVEPIEGTIGLIFASLDIAKKKKKSIGERNAFNTKKNEMSFPYFCKPLT